MFFLGIVIAIVGAAARNIGLTTSQIGILVSTQHTGFIIGIVFASLLSKALRKTSLMVIGSALLVASFGTFYAVNTFSINVLIMLAMGIGIGFYESTTDSALMDLYERGESLYINLNHMFVTVGSLLVTTYLVFLQMQWRRSMLQASAAVLVLGLLFLFSKIKSEKKQDASIFRMIRGFVGSPAFVICGILLLIAVGAQLSVMSITTTYLMQHRGHDQITSKVAALIYLSGVGLGRIAIGFITKKGRIYRTLLVLFPANAVLSFLYFAFDTGAAVYPLALLLGLSLSGLLPLTVAAAGVIHRESAGLAVSLIKLAIPIGGIVVPLALSALSEVLVLPAALMIVPALFAIGTVLTAAAKRVLSSAATH